ncbi:hypothetical protein Tco_0550347, partial [Tanacetum coccineum]
LEWLLEEIHVIWAHLEKKRTRLQIYTKSDEENSHTVAGDGVMVFREANGRLRKLRPKVAWETIKDLAQYEEEKWNDPIFLEKGSPNYIDATLEQELESMECREESLMRNEVLLEYEVGFTFPKGLIRRN